MTGGLLAQCLALYMDSLCVEGSMFEPNQRLPLFHGAGNFTLLAKYTPVDSSQLSLHRQNGLYKSI